MEAGRQMKRRTLVKNQIMRKVKQRKEQKKLQLPLGLVEKSRNQVII